MYYDPVRPDGSRVTPKGRRRRGARVLTGAAVLMLAGAVPAVVNSQQRTPPLTSLVFDGVTVVDVERGQLLADQRVVVADHRIQAVGPMNTVPLPGQAHVVDARGKYLIPGLWNMHVHSDTLSFAYSLLIANGITGIRDTYTSMPFKAQLQWWGDILAGTRVGPPRQLLAGQLPVTNYDQMVAREAAGANFLKMYPFTPELAGPARKVGLPFGGHVGRGVSAIEASDSGMTVLDHVNVSGGLNRLCGADIGTAKWPFGSVAQCQPVVTAFQRNGTWWTPTLLIDAIHRTTDDGKWLAGSRPFCTRLVEVAHDFWAGTPLPHGGNWLRGSTLTNASPAPGSDSLGFLRLAQRVGMPILAGSDEAPAVIQWKKVLPGFALHTELAMLVAEGLTPLTALQSATLNPAKLIHGTDSLGTVAAGKLADLVLLDADPLADITNTTTIRAVVANGRYFDRNALDQLLREAETQATTSASGYPALLRVHPQAEKWCGAGPLADNP